MVQTFLDHLGNTRVVLDDQGSVKQYFDYYPFGMTQREYVTGSEKARYRYTGKELDEAADLDWYYFGSRYYDPSIGRFLTPDPHAENYPAWSPYHYAANNPLIIIDPDGMDWYNFGDKEGADIQWREGSDPQLKPGLGNWLKEKLFGTGEKVQSLGANVLVIQGTEENEQAGTALFELYLESNTEGPTAVALGSTKPADIINQNTMAEGLYTETSLINDYHGSGTTAIAFREGTVESTTGIPMTHVRVHRGNPFSLSQVDSRGNSWSSGCPTFWYDRGGSIRPARRFSSHFVNAMNVYLKRY